MDDNIKKMLNGECPQCKSDSGDISSYLPFINKEGLLEIHLECDNCGCSVISKAKHLESKLIVNI